MADPEGNLGIRSNHALSPNYFIFMGNFWKSWVNWSNRTPLSKFEPPIQNSLIRPCIELSLFETHPLKIPPKLIYSINTCPKYSCPSLNIPKNCTIQDFNTHPLPTHTPPKTIAGKIQRPHLGVNKFWHGNQIMKRFNWIELILIEPHHEKTCIRGSWPG